MGGKVQSCSQTCEEGRSAFVPGWPRNKQPLSNAQTRYFSLNCSASLGQRPLGFTKISGILLCLHVPRPIGDRLLPGSGFSWRKEPSGPQKAAEIRGQRPPRSPGGLQTCPPSSAQICAHVEPTHLGKDGAFFCVLLVPGSRHLRTGRDNSTRVINQFWTSESLGPRSWGGRTCGSARCTGRKERLDSWAAKPCAPRSGSDTSSGKSRVKPKQAGAPAGPRHAEPGHPGGPGMRGRLLRLPLLVPVDADSGVSTES